MVSSTTKPIVSAIASPRRGAALQHLPTIQVLVLGLLVAASALRGQQPPPPAPPPEPPLITIDETSVKATGVTKSGSAIVFGVARRSLTYYERLEARAEILNDADADGAVRFDVPGDVPWKSVWVAVDLTSGLYDISTPAGFPLELLEFPGQGLGAALNSLETAGEFMELLWVRPAATGAAAWTLAVGDGGASDSDDRSGNGRVRVDVARFRPVGSSPSPPEKFAPGDILVGIDSRALTIFATRLAN